MPRTLFKTNLPPPISKNQELCPKSYRRSSAIFCEMGNTLSLQRNKKFLLTFKRYIRKRRVQPNLMRNVRSSKSRLVNCELIALYTSLFIMPWIMPVVSWSRGRETTTKRPTKRNDWSVTN